MLSSGRGARPSSSRFLFFRTWRSSKPPKVNCGQQRGGRGQNKTTHWPQQVPAVFSTTRITHPQDWADTMSHNSSGETSLESGCWIRWPLLLAEVTARCPTGCPTPFSSPSLVVSCALICSLLSLYVNPRQRFFFVRTAWPQPLQLKGSHITIAD